MTDPNVSSVSPEVAEVRRLLAAARHDEPMPSDVASRMDDVLAGLRDEPVRRDDVVPISAARRRKVGALLVAAAVVVVGGAVVAPHLPGGGSAAPTSAADSGGSTKSSELGNSGKAPPAGPASPDASQSLTQMDRLELRDGRVVVHPRRFSVDALRSRSLLPQADAAARLGDCAAVPQHDDVLAARYRRAPAALVFRQARGGSQVVDLYICGSPRPIRSATLPAP
jgi:hypothetical protein